MVVHRNVARGATWSGGERSGWLQAQTDQMGSATSKPARKLGAQTVTQAKPGSLPGTARPQNQAPVVAELSSRFEKDQCA